MSEANVLLSKPLKSRRCDATAWRARDTFCDSVYIPRRDAVAPDSARDSDDCIDAAKERTSLAEAFNLELKSDVFAVTIAEIFPR